MATYGDIYNQVTRNLGNKTEADFGPTVLSYFNLSQDFIAGLHDWPQLQVKATPTMVIGQSAYTWTELQLVRFREDYSVIATIGTRRKPLPFINARRWDEEVEPNFLSAANGEPEVYTYWGTTFSFSRKPAEAYPLVIRYRQFPEPAVNTDSVLQLERAEVILIPLTTSFVFLSYEEFEMAAYWAKRADTAMKLFGISNTNVFSTVASIKQSHSAGDYWANPFVQKMP